uniref:Uncharacterized protein n=1 Tax=Ditylenchus dipsaci TaxID=166011 RepID=A0A915D3A0_9BILA
MAKDRNRRHIVSSDVELIVKISSSVPPVIDRSAIEEIRLKVGQTFQFDVPVSGEPPPTCPWTLVEEPLNRMTE